MRQWEPDRGEQALDDVYADLPPAGRDRWVAVNMVASVDGAVTVDGVSGALGGDGDLAGFRALRASVDVVLVGAGTARAERYGPPKVRPEARGRRLARGQSERPAVALVSRSLDLSGAERLLEGDVRLLVLTPADGPADRRAALEEAGAEVVAVGAGRVDLAAGLDALAARGLGRVLCEGGPGLNHDLLAAGVVDDLFLTLAPQLVGTDGVGIVAGRLPDRLVLELREGRVHEGELLLRYGVGGPAGARG